MIGLGEIFHEVFSAGGFLAALGGAAIDRAGWYLHDRFLDAKAPADKPHRTSFNRSILLTWVLGAILLGWMIVENENTHLATVSEAHRALSCEQHIVAAAIARDKLNAELDGLSTADRKATQDWLTQITAPPPNIAALHTTDPAYQAWAIGITDNYRTQIAGLNTKRAQIADEIKQHPLPQAACGNAVN